MRMVKTAPATRTPWDGTGSAASRAELNKDCFACWCEILFQALCLGVLQNTAFGAPEKLPCRPRFYWSSAKHSIWSSSKPAKASTHSYIFIEILQALQSTAFKALQKAEILCGQHCNSQQEELWEKLQILRSVRKYAERKPSEILNNCKYCKVPVLAQADMLQIEKETHPQRHVCVCVCMHLMRNV